MTLMLRLAADAVALVHLAFVLFVAFGGLLVWRWPRLAWLHVPAVAWGAWIEFAGGTCPLTPLEHGLRRAVGEAGDGGGFIDHYLWPLLYPVGLASEYGSGAPRRRGPPVLTQKIPRQTRSSNGPVAPGRGRARASSSLGTGLFRWRQASGGLA